MGYNTATDLAENLDLSLEQQIAYHLRGNHYPPIPTSMVQPCIDAIDAYWEDDTDREILLPEGITYKGLVSAPAWAILEQHHLSPWTADYDTDDTDLYRED